VSSFTDNNIRPEFDKVLQDIADYVINYKVDSQVAMTTARYCLMDTLGCGLLALQFPKCTAILGPLVPGLTMENGCRVPGTNYELDPIQGAFNIGAMIRWLDFNDTWLAAEWGHPSDNLGGILAVADYLSRQRVAQGQQPLIMADVLQAMIKAHEIRQPPANIEHFIDELAAFVGQVYGPSGEIAYRRNALSSLPRIASHPDVRMWATEGIEPIGFALAVIRRNVAYVSLFHVLSVSRGQAVETALARAVHGSLRAEGVHAVVGEFVGDHGLDLRAVFESLGYTRYERMLMSAELADGRLSSGGETSLDYVNNAWAADVLVDAYRDHPSRPLHPETHERDSHGSPAFRLGTQKSGKFFAHFSDRHHGVEHIAVLVKTSSMDELLSLVESQPDTYFKPAYYGASGWVGVILNRPGVDWDHVSEWLARSWRMVAPARLARLHDAADMF